MRIRKRGFIFIFFYQICIADTTIGVGADGRYITEGRDNIEDEALHYVDLNHEFANLSAALWYAESEAGGYHELNLSLGHEASFSTFSVTSNYTFINFSGADPDDHELALGLGFGEGYWLDGNITSYWSYRSKGVYSTVELSYPSTFGDVGVSPYISLGVNSGYVVNEHRGADHYGLGLRAELEIQALSLSAHISNIQPIAKKSGDTLTSATWLGIFLSFSL